MLRKLLLLTFIVFLGIGFFKYADAHVTLNPNESEPESYDKYVWTRVVTTSAIMVNHYKNNSSYRANVMVRFTRLSHLLCY